MSGRLQRASDALVQDVHSQDAWRAALRSLDASTAVECDQLGVYGEHLRNADGSEEIRLHVPALGGSHEDEGEQDRLIRDAIAAAARSIGLLGEPDMSGIGEIGAAYYVGYRDGQRGSEEAVEPQLHNVIDRAVEQERERRAES